MRRAGRWASVPPNPSNLRLRTRHTRRAHPAPQVRAKNSRVTASRVSTLRTDKIRCACCMFQLATLQDTAVKIIPENLGLPRLEALTQRLENTYVDRVRWLGGTALPPRTAYHRRLSVCLCRAQVIENAGLCVTLYEILSVEGGTIFQGEGDAHFVVKFKLVRIHPLRPACLPQSQSRGAYTPSVSLSHHLHEFEGLRARLGHFSRSFCFRRASVAAAHAFRRSRRLCSGRSWGRCSSAE